MSLLSLFKKKEEKPKDIKFLFYVVDDEPDFREFLEEYLSDKYPAKVESFESVNDVLSSLDKALALPTIIFSDVSMPGRKGFSLKNELKTRDFDVPIIFISGLPGGNIDDEENGLTVLGKPLNFSALDSKITRALPTRKAS